MRRPFTLLDSMSHLGCNVEEQTQTPPNPSDPPAPCPHPKPYLLTRRTGLKNTAVLTVHSRAPHATAQHSAAERSTALQPQDVKHRCTCDALCCKLLRPQSMFATMNTMTAHWHAAQHSISSAVPLTRQARESGSDRGCAVSES